MSHSIKTGTLNVAESIDGKKRQDRISEMDEVDQLNAEKLNELKILHAGTPNTETLNIFRELRTQLLKHQKKQNFVCMVISATDEGGASFVAANLAAVFAMDKAKTSLLVDANLHSPSVDKLVIGDADIGVTDYLSEEVASVKDIVYATGITRLRAMPLGTYSESAAELFASDRMQALIGEIKQRYSDRYIFIDAPPVASSSEARILAELVDLVLLVVPYGETTAEAVDSAIEAVGREKVAGVVYNNY